jgi:hypothetical protein
MVFGHLYNAGVKRIVRRLARLSKAIAIQQSTSVPLHSTRYHQEREQFLPSSFGAGSLVLSVQPRSDRDRVLSAPVHIGAQVLEARVDHQRDHLCIWPQPLCHLNRGDDVCSRGCTCK